MSGEKNLKGLPPADSALGEGVRGGKKERNSERTNRGWTNQNNVEGRIPKHHRLPGENRGGEESEANKSRRGENIGRGQIRKDTND